MMERIKTGIAIDSRSRNNEAGGVFDCVRSGCGGGREIGLASQNGR